MTRSRYPRSARAALGLGTVVALVAVSQPAPGLAASARSSQPLGGAVRQPAMPRGFEPTAVSADSSTDVWTVGNPSAGGDDQHAVVERWDGTTWTRVPLPRMKTSFLSGVVAISPEDVWVVGSNAHEGAQRMILHWDGQTWRRSPSPGLPGSTAFLTSLSASSSTDVWAVGQITTGSQRAALVEHFDGEAWTVVRTPKLGGAAATPVAVSALSPTDVWLAGTTVSATQGSRPLLEHWDGARWSRVKGAGVEPGPAGLWSITAVSASDVWAVGRTGTASEPTTLVEHWDGTAWTAVPVPNPGLGGSLYGVSAASAADVWAVGEYGTATKPITDEPLVLHWDGATWEQQTVAGGPGHFDYLAAVSATSPSDAWAVGFTGSRVLVRHWDGTDWS